MKKLSRFMVRSHPGLVVLLTLSFCVTSPAWGETELEVTNPSFEFPACPANCARDNREGPWTVGDPTGWTGSGARGVFQPNPRQIFDEGFPTEGSQLAYTGSEPGHDSGAYLTQDTKVEIEDGVTYTLSVEVGRRYEGLRFIVALLASDDRVAFSNENDFAGRMPPVRGYGTIEVSYVGTAATAGHPLSIYLQGIGDQVSWDNVRLSRSDPPAEELKVSAWPHKTALEDGSRVAIRLRKVMTNYQGNSKAWVKWLGLLEDGVNVNAIDVELGPRNVFTVKTFKPAGERYYDLPWYVLKASNGKYVRDHDGLKADADLSGATVFARGWNNTDKNHFLRISPSWSEREEYLERVKSHGNFYNLPRSPFVLSGDQVGQWLCGPAPNYGAYVSADVDHFTVD